MLPILATAVELLAKAWNPTPVSKPFPVMQLYGHRRAKYNFCASASVLQSSQAIFIHPHLHVWRENESTSPILEETALAIKPPYVTEFRYEHTSKSKS